MTEEEYQTRLSENKWFDNPKELIDYRLPVVQYWLTNYSKLVININGVLIHTNMIQIKYEDADFALVNQAFMTIKNKQDTKVE